MNNFLLEILSEEIPASMQIGGALQLQSNFETTANEYSIKVKNVKHYYSSQRVAILATVEQNEQKIQIKGPPLSVPEETLKIFLKKNNASSNDLYSDNKYYYISKQYRSDEQLLCLTEICEKTLKKITWPKSITWNGVRWIRPIISILAIFENTEKTYTLEFKFANIASGNYTFGHKILKFNNGSPLKLEIKKITDYEKILEENFVIINPEERKKRILSQLTTKPEHLEELIGFAEFPLVLECSIPSKFTILPQELLNYTMIFHQKYVPGENYNYYVIVDHNNISSKIKHGYERVLNARLLDAEFFWQRFLQTDMLDLIEKLKNIPAENPLLSVYEENRKILNYVNVFFNDNYEENFLDEIRCDISSELITEYPALRGIIASFKIKDSEKQQIAREIYYGVNEIYNRNSINNTKAKKLVFSERIMRLDYFLTEKNEKPTSSQDPFSLQRTAKCIIELILPNLDFINNEFTHHKNTALEISYSILEKLDEKVCSYITEVFQNLLISKNDSLKNIIILIIKNTCINKSFSEILFFINFFINFEDQLGFFATYKRIASLHNKKYINFCDSVNEEFFETQEEKNLYKNIFACRNCDVYHILNNKELINSINEFLNSVRIDTDNNALKTNRIALVKNVYKTLECIFCFDKICDIFN